MKSVFKENKRFVLVLLMVMTVYCGFAQNRTTMSAHVTRTIHKAVVKKDAVDNGNFYFQKADKLCLTFKNGKDAFKMNGKTYTIVMKGRKYVAKGATINLFASLQKALVVAAEGGDLNSLKNLSDTKVSKSGHHTTVTITPVAENAKAAKHQMFTSFIIETEGKELKTIRMNGRGNSYTEYVLSGNVYNTAVPANAF
ncbi:MAG: outer membrane lipoprotein carrier protein LolA [Prevotella sp.]|jgi:hypothetical protein|nr:outer membrane lipoprotein carrier protein LolA [Prevotella sp.]MCI2081491.1 outer membrane lipoprotein carrier protein LolA [Prevotella sp.]MCI2103385.1 outer membrane lipoprotein carrier protein LolA [Prevotella sp.]